jgi:hypothetical protein
VAAQYAKGLVSLDHGAYHKMQRTRQPMAAGQRHNFLARIATRLTLTAGEEP